MIFNFSLFSRLNALRSPGSARSAFTLVEVALALLVVAVGILSVLSLFPAGIDQSSRSAIETHATQFAEEVFGGMRLWAEEGEGLTNYSVPGSADFPSYWGGSMPLITADAGIVTNVYVVTNVYEHKIINHDFRYMLVVTNLTSDITAAKLYVCPGEFGVFTNAMVFYTEFFKSRP